MSWPAGWTSSPPIARGLIAKTSCRNYSLGDAWRTGNAPRWLGQRRRGSPSRTQRHVYQTRRHHRRRAGRAGRQAAAAADDAAKRHRSRGLVVAAGVRVQAHLLREGAQVRDRVMEVELPPRDRPRPASPVPEDSRCAYELTPPEDPLPFEASFDERATYARLHRAAHLRAAASLHCSIVAWTGFWDLVTYCGLAAVWREACRAIYS